jgi:predicted O-methyltransferase YrrM
VIFRHRNPATPSAPPLPAYGRELAPAAAARLVSIVRSVPLDFAGGCSAAKALCLADLMARFDVHDAIESGVYRGRCLLALAEVLRLRGAGRVIGIDPWSADEALQRDDHEVGPAVNEFVRSHPWEHTYREVIARIDRYGLGGHVELLRMTSATAAARIPDRSVGLVHIDGNHDQDAVELDVRLYEPKLAPGGLLVLDDASWGSVRPVLEALRARLEPVLHLHDAVFLHDQEQQSDYAVFRVT